MGKSDASEPTETKAAIARQESTAMPLKNEVELPANVPITHENKVRKEEFDMARTAIVKLTRRQLYDEIWEISVAGVAKKYDIPYTHLMKQVKEANIPIPPSGYWTMLTYGKSVIKLELSEPFDEVVSIFNIDPATRKAKPKEAPKPEVAAEPLPENEKVEKEPTPVALPQNKPVTVVETVPSIQTIQEPETVKWYGQTYNIYNRDTLYKEVWEAPVTEVAKRYKVSDVAIHKVCKALEIPTPPTGYWAKVRAGKPVSVIPLPKSDKVAQKTGIRTGLDYPPEVEKETLLFLSEEDRSVILTVASQILMPDEDSRMHPKIITHRKTIAEWKKRLQENEKKGWNRRNLDLPPFLADNISDETIPRACRIIDALIKAMEPLGCSLTNDLAFVVNGETVRLSFSESQDKTNHIPTKDENIQLLKYEEERKRYSWASKPQIRKYDYVYNGRISLTVNSQKNFRDCKTYVVEDRLGDIMIEIYEAAEALKKAREAREEAERKRQEEERRKEERRKRYNVEVDRTLALINLAEDYDTASKIRGYIAVIEASGSPSADTAEWIEWAKAKADWYDPTIAKDDEFFGKREHEKDADHKKLEHAGYRW
jgi:hypothetical protein